MHESPISPIQAEAFDAMTATALATNAFLQRKYAPLGFSPQRPPRAQDFLRLPFTQKEELVADQQEHFPFGSNLTWPPEKYLRLHQTSGTTGVPLRWLDTQESWQWWLDCWKDVYHAAGVSDRDRILVAFSFGPFIGFWTAFEAGQQLGSTMLTGGGQTTEQRLDLIRDLAPTVFVSTPTYAFRLAEAAAERGMDLASSSIRRTIHAGEPGASIANVQERLQTLFGAECSDHAGATEVGAWGYSCKTAKRLHVNERHFIAEVIDPDSGTVVKPDSAKIESGELVLTNLGRVGSPVIRYRTGDAVRLSREPCSCGHPYATLDGGVIGRVDDMTIVRGINVYPSAIENIVRSVAGIEEFECVTEVRRGTKELIVRIDSRSEDVHALVEGLRDRFPPPDGPSG